MPLNVQARGKRHQLRVTHDHLPQAFFATFDSEREASDYGDALHAMLDREVVPQEPLAPTSTEDDPLLIEVIRSYCKAAPISVSDEAPLGQMLAELAGTRVSGIGYLCRSTDPLCSLSATPDRRVRLLA